MNTIHTKTFYGNSEDECFKKINEEISEDKIINVIPRGTGDDDNWSTYYIDVIYKD